VHLENVTIEARVAGKVCNAANWSFKDVRFRVLDKTGLKLENCANVPQPELGSITASELERVADVRSDGDARAVRLGL
jgi:hypothetical protein